MTQGGWLADAAGKQAMMAGLHPNVPVIRAPPLFSAKTRNAAIGKVKDDGAAAKPVAGDPNAVLAIPVMLMKCVFLWPDSQNVVTRFIASKIWPMSNVVLVLCGTWFILEGSWDSSVTVLTTFGDMMACTICLLKLLLLLREGPKLARMRRRLQHDFTAVEGLAEPEASAANARCTEQCRRISRRFMTCYVPLCGSVVLSLLVNALDPPDKRRLSVSCPSVLLINPYTYWPLLAASVLLPSTFYFYSVAFDTLFLSLCKHMSCKCEILKVMLRRAGQHAAVPKPSAPGKEVARERHPFEYWSDDGSAMEPGSSNGLQLEVRQNLRACVLYHNMIIAMRDEAEDIFAGVSLFQMAYILVGLGVPGLRLLRESDMKPTDFLFLLFYMGWNFSQLLFYCWFADALAASSGSVAAAAYAAMRPAEVDDAPRDAARRGNGPALVNLDKEAGFMLGMITMRAQKPLYLTAGNFCNITLELYLTIIRKSQSIYSYLIRMR